MQVWRSVSCGCSLCFAGRSSGGGGGGAGGGGGSGLRTVFVGGIPKSMTPRAVEKKFLQFGAIDGVRMPGPGSFAFVQYKDADGARIAVRKGHTLFNRSDNVTVEFSHTKEGRGGKRAPAPAKRPPKRKSVTAKKAAAIKKKALRARKRKAAAARDVRETDRDRSPLVLLRRGQRSPSLIGGRSPDASKRRGGSFSPRSPSRSPVGKRRRGSALSAPHTPPSDTQSLSPPPARKSRSPIKARKRGGGGGPVSPRRDWSSSASPGASPERSWSRSASSGGGSRSPAGGRGDYCSYSGSRSPTPEQPLSDRSRSRSLSPVFKRKKKGRPSTPSDPSPPLSYRSSMTPRSNADVMSPARSRTLSRSPSRSRSRSISPRGQKKWRRDSRSPSVSPERDIDGGGDGSPGPKSPLKKRKRNRGVKKSRKRGPRAGSIEAPPRRDSAGGRAASGSVKKKKKQAKVQRVKVKNRLGPPVGSGPMGDMEGGAKTTKPVPLLDIKVKPAIRPLMELTPIRRPPSPRDRGGRGDRGGAGSPPRPLLSRSARSMSMSPTPSPHRQPIDSYRRSPSPNYSYGGYRGGLYYRQQGAGSGGSGGYRGDARGGDSNAAGYKGSGAYGGGGNYADPWDRDRNRMSPPPLMSSSGYTMTNTGSYRRSPPPRRR